MSPRNIVRRRAGWLPRRGVTGFTLVEMLVVIGIIGILLALAIPAVQIAREAARRTTCRNNLKQMSLGVLQHAEAHRHLPTGGWGWHWVGDPDRGYDRRQPGGWFYNILPYIEQESLHESGRAMPPDEKRAELNALTKTPLSIMNCPSRRSSVLYPKPAAGTYVARNAADNDPSHNMAARGDYAANCGSQSHNEYGPGPMSLEEGDNPDFPWYDIRACNGVIYERSEIRMAQIRDGESNTLLLGEKYLNPDAYATGLDPSDNENLYTGFNSDLYRSTYYHRATGRGWPPMQDRPGLSSPFHFGGPHVDACHFAFCDGSVRSIHYTIDAEVFSYLGSRDDGMAPGETSP